MFWIGFIVGFFTGALIGIVLLAAVNAGKDNQ